MRANEPWRRSSRDSVSAGYDIAAAPRPLGRVDRPVPVDVRLGGPRGDHRWPHHPAIAPAGAAEADRCLTLRVEQLLRRRRRRRDGPRPLLVAGILRQAELSQSPAAPAGMHSENFAINQKVEAFMAEHPDKSFDEALRHVEGELQKAGA